MELQQQGALPQTVQPLLVQRAPSTGRDHRPHQLDGAQGMLTGTVALFHLQL